MWRAIGVFSVSRGKDCIRSVLFDMGSREDNVCFTHRKGPCMVGHVRMGRYEGREQLWLMPGL